ncbi:MAG: Lrp/AsnC family transcriptional regulator [Thaumarchaeota archaeon]|nr:Lrp/AsnC family transcriptional regulator [Nitrososphaerota archaeon]
MPRGTDEGEKGKNDVAARTAQLVQLLTELGPDIPEISRRLGQFKESVRYRYKQKILGEGFAIQAAVNHEGLGLKRVVLLAKFSAPYEAYGETILTAMNELCYVVSFERTLPEGEFLVNASVPSEFLHDFTSFISALHDRGLFSRVEVYSFDSMRNVPMRAEFFDFDEGIWDFDFSSSTKFEPAAYVASKKARFDYVDLLLLKELQVDATRSLTEIAAGLKLNYKMLAWHFSEHVLRRGLIKGYTVNWMGTRYESKIEKALHRRHRYVRVDLLARCRDEPERMGLMSKSNMLPFLWAEAYGSDYYAQFAFPVDFVNEAMQYLRQAFHDLDGRGGFRFLDQTDALAFTISYKLFDAEEKRWTFDSSKLLANFDGLLQKIKEGSG